MQCALEGLQTTEDERESQRDMCHFRTHSTPAYMYIHTYIRVRTRTHIRMHSHTHTCEIGLDEPVNVVGWDREEVLVLQEDVAIRHVP